MIRDLEIKILNNKAIIPSYAKPGDAGLDLSACIDHAVSIAPLETRLIGTGLAICMNRVPEHLMAVIVPRSGKGHKEGKILGNSIGIIDEGYQGELMVSMYNRNKDTYITINPGEKIAQLILVPIISANFIIVNEFSTNTVRGSGGFGSSDAI